MYTHWEQKINARPGNYGSRIDYILSSIEMKDWFEEANIQEGLVGSDHCPVYAVLKDRVTVEGQPVHLLEIANPPGVFDGQQRLRPIDIRDHPVFSAKLLPEFDKRRSIKDMLSRKQSARNHESTGTKSNKPETSEISPAATASERASSVRLQTSDDAAQLPSQPNSSTQSKREHSSLDSPSKSKRAKLSSAGEKPQRQPTLNSFFLPKVATNKAVSANRE
jgi:AP endonuclease-2